MTDAYESPSFDGSFFTVARGLTVHTASRSAVLRFALRITRYAKRNTPKPRKSTMTSLTPPQCIVECMEHDYADRPEA